MSTHSSQDQAKSGKLKSHIPSLDGVRGLAVLLVIVHHFALEQTVGTGFTKVVLRLSEVGWCGVDLFFALSGFLITGILLESKHQAAPIRTFYVRRSLRIFPLYYITLIGLIFIWPALSSAPEQFNQLKDNQAWYWSYLSNVLIVLKIPLGPIETSHFWSLAVEEQFYMVWPFIVLFVSVKSLRRICVAMLLIALAFRSSCFLLGWGHSPAYVLTISRIDALGLGALVATILREPGLRSPLARYAPGMILVLAGLFLVIVAVQGSFHRGPLMLSVGLSILAGIFALLIGLAALEQRPLLKRILEAGPLRFFGKYSYAMYIFHPFIVFWMRSWFPDLIGTTGWLSAGLPRFLVFSLIGLGLTCLAALLSWNLFEQRFLGLKKYFEPKPLPAS